jgi:hypothetical protein
MADPTASHARTRLGGGARAGGGGARRRTAAGVAGDDQTSAPGHEIVRGKLLHVAGNIAILTKRLHG